MSVLAGLILGYLCGAIPTGVVVARLFGLGDLRRIGSGNIGATNVLRTGDKRAAALTLFGDMLKGTIPVLIAAWFLGPWGALAAAAGAVIGHIFPVWLGFKGGKGVATYLGVVLGLAWPAGLLTALVWLATAKLTRISSASALAATALAPAFLWYFAGGTAALVALALAVLVWQRHSANIARLQAGTEPKIGQS